MAEFRPRNPAAGLGRGALQSYAARWSASIWRSQYILALRAKNCATGDILADEQAQVARKEDVLGSLSQMASQVRERLGESRVTIEKYSRPLQEATTASLDAWKAFTTATQVFASSGRARAVPLFERAIAIDPDFAVAHARLGIYYSNDGESALSRQSTTKAYKLRHRASDAERFFIESCKESRAPNKSHESPRGSCSSALQKAAPARFS